MVETRAETVIMTDFLIKSLGVISMILTFLFEKIISFFKVSINT